MVKELWNQFPRLLEERINALLDFAEPNPQKSFHLYKACQSEGAWEKSYESFAACMHRFFELPKKDRQKSWLDQCMQRPLSSQAFEQFHLDFRNALVSQKSVMDIASWAHHLIRINKNTDSVVISQDVLGRSLQNLTTPGPWGKAQDIEFEDFCQSWEKTVFKLFGKKYDQELADILREMRWLLRKIQEEENNERDERGHYPTIYLTQTEIDWVLDILKAVETQQTLPKFPLSRGPQKQRLMDLEKTVTLYKIVQKTQLPELIRHRDNIRATIYERCASLLRDKAA